MRIQSSYWLLFLYFFSSFFRLHLTLVSGQCLDNQKSLLLSLKNELKFDSSLSTKLVGWNQSGDCCGWGGVTCDKSGHVIGLDLNHESISGGFNGSSSLFRLKNLSVILLDENTLSSQIPESFANFQNLTVLSLRACNLSGPLPKKIFQVPTLKTIDLSSNVILKGPLPEFNGALETLVLSYTEVGGVLPDSIGNLPLLSRIELRGCKFTGPIPDSMRKLTRLVYVDLSSNHLTGSIPSLQGSRNLASLNLYQNNLTGGIPSFQGVNSLQFLDLSYNSLTGDFPVSLLTLPSIEYVYLSNNRLSGQISGKGIVVSSYKIRNLDLSRNKFEGPIPGFIFKLPVLSTLMLSENNFNGVVDLETFGKFKELYALELSYNQLTVRANATKSSISSLSDQLNTLKLASCKMQELPILKNHSRLMMLDFSDNELTGEIPNWIWEVGNGYLRFLNLSQNRFSNLQKPYTFPFLLDVLDLHSNYLKGEIPVPPRRVYHLDYSSNNFGSSIPFDFGNVLRSTLFFSIAKSKVTGVIPQSIRNATSLRTLDLSHNTLTGPIPAIGNLKDLQSLDLSVNKLNGSIPEEIATLGSLSFLNVSYNHLSGKIPQGSKFQMFTELSFEGNKELCGPPLKKSCNKKRI